MKKKILGKILAVSGLFGFLLLLYGTGRMETGSISFIGGTYIILAGLAILVLVIFVGVPYCDKLTKIELPEPELPKWQQEKKEWLGLV